MSNKLNFGLYCYGDPALRADVDNGNCYIIEQDDKFELRYFENLGRDGVKTSFTGYYNTIYDALDAANAHYTTQQEDKFIMPLRQELEIFEDNQPDRPRRTNLRGVCE